MFQNLLKFNIKSAEHKWLYANHRQRDSGHTCVPNTAVLNWVIYIFSHNYRKSHGLPE